jgi:hypothetical protein
MAHLLYLVACQQVQVLVYGARAVDVAVGRVRSPACVPVDPLEPMLSTVSSNQVLKIIGGWDALSFDGTEEVLLDRVTVVAKGHLDGAFETVEVTVVARSLVGLVLFHERNKFLGGPALGLEVIVVGSRCASVHLAIGQTRTTDSSWIDLTMKLMEEPPPRM